MRRRNSVRDVRAPRLRAWAGVVAFGIYGSSIVGGCATAVDTLEPEQPSAGDGGSGATTGDGGKPSAAGTKPTGGSVTSAGSSGGSKLMGAFGGTTTGGSQGGAGGAAGAGTAGSGGKASGGAGGASGAASSAGAGGQAGSGAGSGGKPSGGAGGGAGAGAGGGAGAPLACLMSWKGDKCDTCSSQVQSDKAACSLILDCYYQNGCGPTMCGGNTDKCGANAFGKGTAGYPIAQDVYSCLCK